MNCDNDTTLSKIVHINCSNKNMQERDSATYISNSNSNFKSLSNDSKDEFYFIFSPNPCKSMIQAEYSINTNEFTIDFYNTTGSKQKEFTLRGGKDKKILDISDLSAGVYSYRVFDGNSLLKTDRIVVVK